MKTLVFLILAAAFALPADACAKRHRSVKLAFVRAHACPATGLHKLPCPGYVIDHIVPLCDRGLDKPSNMQWQTVAEGKAKDKLERRQCSPS